MKKEIKKRVMAECNYMIKTNKTIREIANYYNVSKSTVHKDLKERLKQIDKEKNKQIVVIMNNHLKQRHINGGIATRKKYQH